ncbi:MAG: glycosyltransferase [Chitinivibrionales bacterium]|nr:glycosyltransferase [Chitinivibrionales bacterium]MBD3394412.1 glycosyltransferase [Chitinivibrionales bacterium]
MPPQHSRTLSVCLIVKNEAARLRRCLESVLPAAGQIVVVDTGSTDNTGEIARDCGALVVESAWQDDFSRARNVSLQHASGDWILWLDADDIVPEESIDGLKGLTAREPDTVFAMVVRNQKPGGIGSEFMQARMFPNKKGIHFERRIHEQLMPSALRQGMKLENTAVVIEHHGYGDPGEMAAKARRNIALLKADYDRARPDPVSAVEIADSYSIIEDLDNAIQWYEHTLAIDRCEDIMPVIASQAHVGLGNMLNKKDLHERAVAEFEHALRLCPGRSDALYCLAVAQDLAGRQEQAVCTLERIIGGERSPTVQVSIDFRQAEIKAYLRLAAILGMMKRWDALNPVVERGLAKHGGRPEILNMAALAQYQQGKYMDALHGFEKSLRVAVEGNIDAYLGLCAIYLRAGRKDTLEQTVDKILPLFSGSPRFWAFCALTREPCPAIPGDVDQAKVEKEKEFLARAYGLPASKGDA